MAGNRKLAEKMILELIDDMDSSGINGKIYREEILPNKTDAQFDQWMTNIETGKEFLPLYYPNMTNSAINTANNLKVAEKWGIDIFQRVKATDTVTGQEAISPHKRPILYLPVRRLAQTLEKKRAVADDNIHLDELTDQVTGVSKASAVSNPEILILNSMGFTNMLTEWMKYRGGDQKGYRLMERMIAETGRVNTEVLDPFSGQNKAATTVASILKAMHIDNNLADK